MSKGIMKTFTEDVNGLHEEKQAFQKKNVTFSTLEFRSYPYGLGNHPDCIRGAPITIEWSPINTYSISVDKFENAKPPKRSMQELMMPASERKRILLSHGVSIHDIHGASISARRDKENRRKTIAMAELKTIEAILDYLTQLRRKLFGK